MLIYIYWNITPNLSRFVMSGPARDQVLALDIHMDIHSRIETSRKLWGLMCTKYLFTCHDNGTSNTIFRLALLKSIFVGAIYKFPLLVQHVQGGVEALFLGQCIKHRASDEFSQGISFLKSMDQTTELGGHCFCKSVIYKINIPTSSLPLQSGLCVCADCRHASGSILVQLSNQKLH